MVRKDAGYLKELRVKEIANLMSTSVKEGINTESLLDMIEYNYGLKRSTAQEYVDLIVRVNKWHMSLDSITLGEVKQNEPA